LSVWLGCSCSRLNWMQHRCILELQGRPAKNALSMKRDCLALAVGFLACFEGPWFIAFCLGFLFCVCAQRYPIGGQRRYGKHLHFDGTGESAFA
jgi:hypothetical protein